MFRSSPRPTSGPSVVDAATFLRQFDAFTGGMFRNFDWDRVVAIGGAVSGLNKRRIHLTCVFSMSFTCFYR